MADSQRTVLIAVDGSNPADAAVNFYATKLKLPNDKLLLIHVPQQFSMKDASPGIMNELLTKMKKSSEETKERYLRKLSQLGINGEVHIRFGDSAAEAILEYATEVNATIIIVGTRGQGKFRRTIMGSVSDAILHHAHVPVLVCRPS